MNKDGIIVTYKDGSTKGIKLGKVYGTAEGTFYPHPILANVKLNETFKKDDIIAYNSNFFEVDFLDGKSIVYKTNNAVKTALYESKQTFEDSSAVSKRVKNSFSAKTSKLKTVVVDFNQGIHELVTEGQVVKPKDHLVLIEDEITANVGSFDLSSLQALKDLATQAPMAKYNATIGKIEVFYFGDKNEMSDSLRAMVDKYEKSARSKAKSSGGSLSSSEVTGDLNVGGKPLQKNQVAFYIYLDIVQDMGVGDKAIFANQLKSVVGEVMDHDLVTQSGDHVDAIFGYRSISARIVNSPIIMGTTITLLKTIAKQAVTLYKN